MSTFDPTTACEITEDFVLPYASAIFWKSIEEARRARTEFIISVLCEQASQSRMSRGHLQPQVWRELQYGRRLGSTLLEHRLRSAALFAEGECTSKFLEMFVPGNDLFGYKVISPAIYPFAISQANVNCIAPRIGDAPAYLIGSDTVIEPSELLLRLVEESLLAIQRHGGSTILGSTGSVILVRERTLYGTSNSWTTTSLPGTIYTDWTRSPLALGCELIHEASHLWLNDAFRATGFPEDDQQLFPSPWKGTSRHKFGFIHGVFAFSLVLSYSLRVLASSSQEGSLDFIRSTAYRERERLSSVRSHVDVALVGLDPDLSNIIRTVLDLALDTN